MEKQVYFEDQLENGLRVLRVPAEIGSVLTLCLADTGSRYEKPEEWGIAHFFEHMVFKGTKKYPDAKTISRMIDGIGADFNAFTGDEYTGYYIKATSEKVDLSLDMISDMLLLPKLLQTEIDKERGVILEELNMYVDSPTSHVRNKFNEMVYARSGLGHDIIGRKETIANINRENFQEFLQKWYGLDNLLLVLAGDKKVVGTEKILEKIEKSFTKLEQSRDKKPQRENYLEAGEFQYGGNLEVIFRETEQAHFVLGWPGLKIGDVDECAMCLLKIILGGNMSSRLFTEIREKRGLCYYVGTMTDMNLDSGIFGARAGVSLDKIDEALQRTAEEFMMVASGKKKINEEELVRAKEFVKGQTILGLEDIASLGQDLGLGKILEGKVVTPQEDLKRFDETNLEEVQAVAERIIKEGELKLALIGPYKDKMRFEKIIAGF